MATARAQHPVSTCTVVVRCHSLLETRKAEGVNRCARGQLHHAETCDLANPAPVPKAALTLTRVFGLKVGRETGRQAAASGGLCGESKSSPHHWIQHVPGRSLKRVHGCYLQALSLRQAWCVHIQTQSSSRLHRHACCTVVGRSKNR